MVIGERLKLWRRWPVLWRFRCVTTKQDREIHAFAKLFSRMDDKKLGLLFHMASKMANRA